MAVTRQQKVPTCQVSAMPLRPPWLASVVRPNRPSPNHSPRAGAPISVMSSGNPGMSPRASPLAPMPTTDDALGGRRRVPTGERSCETSVYTG